MKKKIEIKIKSWFKKSWFGRKVKILYILYHRYVPARYLIWQRRKFYFFVQWATFIWLYPCCQYLMYVHVIEYWNDRIFYPQIHLVYGRLFFGMILSMWIHYNIYFLLSTFSAKVFWFARRYTYVCLFCMLAVYQEIFNEEIVRFGQTLKPCPIEYFPAWDLFDCFCWRYLWIGGIWYVFTALIYAGTEEYTDVDVEEFHDFEEDDDDVIPVKYYNRDLQSTLYGPDTIELAMEYKRIINCGKVPLEMYWDDEMAMSAEQKDANYLAFIKYDVSRSFYPEDYDEPPREMYWHYYDVRHPIPFMRLRYNQALRDRGKRKAIQRQNFIQGWIMFWSYFRGNMGAFTISIYYYINRLLHFLAYKPIYSVGPYSTYTKWISETVKDRMEEDWVYNTIGWSWGKYFQMWFDWIFYQIKFYKKWFRASKQHFRNKALERKFAQYLMHWRTVEEVHKCIGEYRQVHLKRWFWLFNRYGLARRYPSGVHMQDKWDKFDDNIEYHFYRDYDPLLFLSEDEEFLQELKDRIKDRKWQVWTLKFPRYITGQGWEQKLSTDEETADVEELYILTSKKYALTLKTFFPPEDTDYDETEEAEIKHLMRWGLGGWFTRLMFYDKTFKTKRMKF